jgi:Family of unknown function (DUF6065)
MTESSDNDNNFFAYEIYPPVEVSLKAAPINRPWMDESNQRFAYRCLPLTIANQAGWFVGCPASFTANWNGGLEPKDVTIVWDVVPPDNRISSLFGNGTVTINMPFLFRTPKGINLWVKGPTNWPKDGAWPLEGVVETDWTSATFTMNWKLTRPGLPVRFERGEPICMVVPFPRHLLSSMNPIRTPLSNDPVSEERHRNWSRDRDAFHRKIEERDEVAINQGWQKDYFQGRDPGLESFADHQTKLGVREFESIS